MKHIEIGWIDIRKNIRKNGKRMLIIFVAFLFIGLLWGYIEIKTFKQELYTTEDTIVQKVNLDHLEKDESYYYSAFMELKEKSCGLNAYIQYLKQVNLSGENMSRVSELEKFSMDERRVFAEIQEFFISRKPMICDDMDAVNKFVGQKLELARLRVDKAIKTLEEKEEKAEEKDRNLKIYAEQEVEILEEYLKKMSEVDLDSIQQTNVRMDQLLEEGTVSINGLVERFNNLIAEIEKKEQYDVVYNPYLLKEYVDMAGIAGELYEEDVVNVKKNEALIYARSIAGVDSRIERFYAVLTFSVLLGAAFSLLYGALRNQKPC